MKITQDIKKQGEKLKKKLGFEKIYVNIKGEYFSQECDAANSVGGDNSKYCEIKEETKQLKIEN